MTLSTNFQDDVLASSNSKRKYNMIHNSDGTVSFEDVTVYSQEGSDFGAKEVNEERTEINRQATLLGNTDISDIEDGTVTGAIAGLNGNVGDLSWLSTEEKKDLVAAVNELYWKMEWSDAITLGSTYGIEIKYRYNAKFVEIQYGGTLPGGVGFGAGTNGYEFPSMPKEFLPASNIRQPIFCPGNGNKLCIRIYPLATDKWSIAPGSVGFTSTQEYIAGTFVYARI